MGLFDNIFLDEDAATAIAEVPQEKPTEPEGTNPVAETPTETVSQADSFNEMLENTPPTPESLPTNTQNTTPEETLSANAGDNSTTVDISPITPPSTTSSEVAQSTPGEISFDIGGDLDFGAPMSPSSLAEEGEKNESKESTEANPVTFKVNGVEYSNNETTPSDTTETTAESSSIAMIQGSTAAGGISIIDTTDASAGNGIMDIINEPTNTEPQDDNIKGLSVIEEKTGEESAAETLTPTLPEAANLSDITPEITFSEPTKVDVSGTIVIEKIEDHDEIEKEHNEPTPVLDEIATPTESIDTVAASIDKDAQYFPELTTFLDNCIKELNDREQTINTIVLQRRKLARRRMEIEDDYKTKILALNMEDEYLRNKAERERAEQDRLLGVIKSFQKKLAHSEE